LDPTSEPSRSPRANLLAEIRMTSRESVLPSALCEPAPCQHIAFAPPPAGSRALARPLLSHRPSSRPRTIESSIFYLIDSGCPANHQSLSETQNKIVSSKSARFCSPANLWFHLKRPAIVRALAVHLQPRGA